MDSNGLIETTWNRKKWSKSIYRLDLDSVCPYTTQQDWVQFNVLTFVQRKGKKQESQGKFQPDIRKKECFTMTVVQPWNKLPTEAAESPSLETF